MNILVCVKRVPQTGGRIVLTADGQEIDTRHLGFTVSPHEECAVEEAVRIVEAGGGSTVVMTLGPAEAAEQLRDAIALGIEEAVLLETTVPDWDPIATASALTDAIRAEEAAGGPFDVILAGNESADSGGFQVAIRIAVALDRPFITGVKALEFADGRAIARREAGGGRDVFETPLPALITVREGLNLPRYPSVPGRLRAKRKEIKTVAVSPAGGGGPTKLGLRLPVEEGAQVEVLGSGPDAAPRVVEVLQRIGVIAR
jgi:electron transfer flavoprotein beta subunit